MRLGLPFGIGPKANSENINQAGPVCESGQCIQQLISLRKRAYSNILKILLPKKGNFSDKKNSDIFHIPAQNIDCG